MKKSSNFKFILIQAIIWFIILGIQSLPLIFIPKLNVLKYEPWQIILDLFVNIFLLILVSLGLKYFFNKKINLFQFNFWEVIKLCFLFISATLVYYFALIAYNFLVVTYVYNRPDIFNHPSQGIKSKILVFIILFIIFFLWTLIYTIYTSTVKLKDNLLEKVNLESNLKESQLNALKGQINPHFMFNSLNNIRGLILENPEKSREMITRLSEMLRYSLTKSDINTIALEEEIEMVENFIAISKIQLEERLKYTENVDKDTLKTQIPPMIIQLLIENAVKHGIATLKNGGEIVLTTKIENNFLNITVTNTGKLIFDESSTKLGLKNIEQRLNLLYGKQATFSLKEVESLVVATILIPDNLKQ